MAYCAIPVYQRKPENITPDPFKKSFFTDDPIPTLADGQLLGMKLPEEPAKKKKKARKRKNERENRTILKKSAMDPFRRFLFFFITSIQVL